MTLPLTEALEELIELGVEGPALVAAMRRLEAVTYEQRIQSLEEAVRAASEREDAELAARNAKKAKDRERKRSRSAVSTEFHGNPGNGAEINGASTEVPEALSLPPSPHTPQPPTHARSVSSTRVAHEREEAGFAKFWAAYPRKTAKADARKAFSKAWRKLPPMDEEQVLIGGLERAKASWTDAQFIPHASTWLNGERWTDEPAAVIPLQPRQAHERPDPNDKFSRRQANHARALAGADSAARQRWEP